MWSKPVLKTIYTLEVDGYAPEVIALTRPSLERYARKIRAEIVVIRERQFPAWPVTYEKLQIYERAQARGSDWNLYVDADALVHPDLPDVTEMIGKDTVLHTGVDFASCRWSYDRFFRRDGRHIGSCNWFTLASDWCIELWKPPDDLTYAEVLAAIHPIVSETTTIITPEHLVDDYVLSRNIAKYGLKFVTLRDLLGRIGQGGNVYLWHEYTIPVAEKVAALAKTRVEWKL